MIKQAICSSQAKVLMFEEFVVECDHILEICHFYTEISFCDMRKQTISKYFALFRNITGNMNWISYLLQCFL